MSAMGRRLPIILTLAGGLPMIAGAVGMALFLDGQPAEYAWTRVSLILYSASLLSFLGGTRWGATLAQGNTAGIFILSVLTTIAAPALAYLGVLKNAQLAFGGLVACFLVHFGWDWLAIRRQELPDDYFRARLVGTAITCVSLLAATALAR